MSILYNRQHVLYLNFVDEYIMMMHTNSSSRTFVKKYKILILGIIVFAVGVTFFGVSWNFLEKMYMCENYNAERFLPSTIITVKCKVVADVGQNLYFRSIFYSHAGTDVIKIPAHLEIKDPDDNVIRNMDFDDKLVISFQPDKMGTYVATITSLEDKNNRIHSGSPQIWYALGFLVGYDDVQNPVGDALIWMYRLGNFIFLAGIGIIIYGIIRARKKSTS